MDRGLEDAIKTIKETAVKNDKRVGIYCKSGEQARKYAFEGFHMPSLNC